MLKLIQGYYHFLCLGKFLEQMILTNDLSELAFDLPIKTGKNTYFLIKESMIKTLLKDISHHPEKRNVFGYLLEISAFKGIFSVMREKIENDDIFREALKMQLQDQYFPFEQLIRFLRNVLNHATGASLSLKKEDFEIQKEYILSPKIQRVHGLKGSAALSFSFVYAKYITQWKGSKDYSISVALDFAKLQEGILLEDLISWHNLYLLAELCFNLSQIVEHGFIQKKPAEKPHLSKKNNKKTFSKQKKTGLTKANTHSIQPSPLEKKNLASTSPILPSKTLEKKNSTLGAIKQPRSSLQRKKTFIKKSSLPVQEGAKNFSPIEKTSLISGKASSLGIKKQATSDQEHISSPGTLKKVASKRMVSSSKRNFSLKKKENPPKRSSY